MNGVNDAMILRRFAQKMAATLPVARGMNDLTVGLPPLGHSPQVIDSAPDRNLPESATGAPKTLPAGSRYDPMAGETRPLLPRTGVRQHAEGALADANAALRPYTGGDITPTDLIAGLGGAGLGGLGAMGLARLFQSERDKERGRTPMLAGLAGAGAGAIGLPMLLKYLASQGGAQTAAAPDVAKQIIANA